MLNNIAIWIGMKPVILIYEYNWNGLVRTIGAYAKKATISYENKSNKSNQTQKKKNMKLRDKQKIYYREMETNSGKQFEIWNILWRARITLNKNTRNYDRTAAAEL